MNLNQIIVSKVDQLHKGGIKKKDAFKQVAEELNITISVCRNNYYDDYEKVKKIKKEKVKKEKLFSNDDVDFIINTIPEFVSKGKKVKDGIAYCADKLSIDYMKVRGVWERERDKRNLKTRERDTTPWTEKDDKIIVDTLIKESKKRRPMVDIFPEIDIMLNRKEGSSSSRWNNKLRYQHDNKIEKSYFQWNDEKDKILLEIIQKNVAMNKPLKDAFVEAAEILQENCTNFTCATRYQEKFIDKKLELKIQKGTWTEEEDKILKSIMKKEIQNGKTDWDAALIAEKALVNRPHRSCLSRWNNEFKTNKESMPRWTEEEDLVLINCIKESKTKTEGCRKASEILKRRSYDSCVQRYDLRLKDKVSA